MHPFFGHAQQLHRGSIIRKGADYLLDQPFGRRRASRDSERAHAVEHVVAHVGQRIDKESARAAHAMPMGQLRKVFALLLYALAAYMLWKGLVP